MGSIVSAIYARKQYKESKKQAKKAESKEAALARAESAGKAAEAQTIESASVVEAEKRKRRGLSDAFSSASSGEGLGE